MCVVGVLSGFIINVLQEWNQISSKLGILPLEIAMVMMTVKERYNEDMI